MVLAFNVVTVAMVMGEAVRFKGEGEGRVTRWVKGFSEGRERREGTVVATHIWLLMGCAFPFTASYILMGGGVMTTEWVSWSCAGIVFLGIGDTAAAVFGKQYGINRWREISNKTKEGSSFCILGVGVIYYFLNIIIDNKINNLFLCFIFAAIPSAVLEGCTL